MRFHAPCSHTHPDGLHEFIGGGPQALFDRRISKFAGNL
jgi:hypothetical protein